MESLAQLEALCERLYNSQDSAERAHAENTLKCFSTNADYISQCQYILDNASTPYALMLASSSLLKQVTEQRLPLQLRLDIRNYLTNYLATRGPDLEPFVIGSLIQLFCRVIKFGWLDDDSFREVVKESMNFLNQSTFHFAIGLKILNQLISEMNQPNPGLSSTHHRRVACSFRDQSLLQIFRISLTSLCQLKNDVGSKLQQLALSLSLKCLSFDFVGTSFDESSDDFGSIQIPSSWKPVIEDPATLQTFFDYYAITKPPLSKEALECLVRLVSVRRSLFTNDSTRLKYLAHLMTGTKEIMETGKGLADHDNYHEFCRLLGRFKVNYQLSEIVNMEGYSSWISLVTEFTLKSLQSWQWASSGVYYLLGLWSRLVTSVPYLKGNSPNLLNEFVPKIIEHFISSKFDSIQAGLSDDLSGDPLDNVELLQDQLECIPYLCRFQYESCSTFIMQITDPILQMYMEAVNLPALADNSELVIIEAKLAWVVHIIAAILKTRQLVGLSADSHEIQDAELSARVLRLINVIDSGLHSQFVLNKSQRLTFDSSSPNGILLFREVSKLTVAYGSRIVSLANCADLYTFKYKGIWILLSVLSRALAGNYVNFGVFELYGDRALSDALDTVLKLLISIPLVDILAYRKLTAAYFAFLEVLLNCHITFVLNLDTSTFRHIVGSLESGLRGVDTNILSQCASAVDNLATFYFNNITVGESPTTPAALNLARHVADCPGVFPEILKTLFEIVLFEDCGNQWSFSRPMLSLILISEEMFTNLRAQILASQPVDQQPRLSLCFDQLMADITRSLETKNRDKFTQNLTKFRNDFRSR
ncbi:Exportin-7 like [Actinidia chinensis var. chinensis]|uniref:Exportin-7 like n=1 Tax=Actinidia chinensis var. chinensis TaxID=1590841 RepID=A0A2R6QVI5_ACTCC|nr:Exportin-7 like [Actinidia chinensis var. chinensis]